MMYIHVQKYLYIVYIYMMERLQGPAVLYISSTIWIISISPPPPYDPDTQPYT